MIHWTATAKKKARRGRRDAQPREARKTLDAARARTAMAKFFARRTETWLDGEPGADDACRQLMQRVRESLPSADWTPQSVEVEAARAAMLVDYDSVGADVVSEWLIPFWVATHSGTFATEALLMAAGFKRSWHVRVNKTAGWYLARGNSEFGPKHRPLAGWGGLRAELAFISASNYQGAVAHASQVRASVSLGLRCALSYAFATEVGWADEDLRACLALSEYPGFGATLLAAANADVAAGVARSCPTWAIDEEHVYSGLDALGDGDVPVLSILLARGHGDVSARAARALALVEADDAADLLARSLSDTKLRRIADTFFHQYPGLAARSFGRVFANAAAPGRAVAGALWDALCIEQRAATEAIAGQLDAPAVTVLAELRRIGTAEAEEQSSPEHARMAELWKRIETWLTSHHPSEADMLSPPAVAEELEAVEASIGRPVPPLLRASLMVHNGESDEPVGLLYSYELLQTTQILDEWKTMKEVAATWSDEQNTALDPVEGVQLRHWHTGWIPIAADGGGNFFCVDADPAPGGHVGQVLFFDHEVGPTYVAARDLAEWLTVFANKLEGGTMHIWGSGALSDEPDPED